MGEYKLQSCSQLTVFHLLWLISPGPPHMISQSHIARPPRASLCPVTSKLQLYCYGNKYYIRWEKYVKRPRDFSLTGKLLINRVLQSRRRKTVQKATLTGRNKDFVWKRFLIRNVLVYLGYTKRQFKPRKGKVISQENDFFANPRLCSETERTGQAKFVFHCED